MIKIIMCILRKFCAYCEMETARQLVLTNKLTILILAKQMLMVTAFKMKKSMFDFSTVGYKI